MARIIQTDRIVVTAKTHTHLRLPPRQSARRRICWSAKINTKSTELLCSATHVVRAQRRHSDGVESPDRIALVLPGQGLGRQTYLLVHDRRVQAGMGLGRDLRSNRFDNKARVSFVDAERSTVEDDPDSGHGEEKSYCGFRVF